MFDEVGEAGRNVGIVAMHGLDAPRHAEQFRDLATMRLVVARKDVVDQAIDVLGRLGGAGLRFERLEFAASSPGSFWRAAMASASETLPPQQKSSFSARKSAVAPGSAVAMSASVRLAKSVAGM